MTHLIDGLALPEEWGVLALPAGSGPIIVRPAPALTPKAPVRRDLPDYVRRHAEKRWRFDGERLHAVAGRYTVASRLQQEADSLAQEDAPSAGRD